MRRFEGPNKKKVNKPRTTRAEWGATLYALTALGAAVTPNAMKEVRAADERAKAVGEVTPEMKAGAENLLDVPLQKAELPPAPLEGRFENTVSAYRTMYGTMTKGQVLFIDQNGKAMGAPREVEYTIAGKDTGFNGKALAEARVAVCAEYPGAVCDVKNKLPRQINNLGPLKYLDTEATYMDIVRKNGHEEKVLPLPGVEGSQKGEGLSRIMYVWKHVGDSMKIENAQARARITDLAPALIAQESGYENDLTSDAGAKNLMQIMPRTRENLGYTEKEMLYLRTQVEAMGELFRQKINSVQAGEGVKKLKETFFADENDTGEFLDAIVIPATITSYNAGPTGIKDVILWFTNKYPTREAYEKANGRLPEKIDAGFFLAILQEAHKSKKFDWLGDDVLTYYIRIVALAEEMKAQKFYGDQES
jgi:hypothetical protein